jgi:transposase
LLQQIDELDLTEKVDSRLPLDASKGVKITMGDRVKAMILNGLGFMDDRLYMFEKFLENKPVDRLFGKDVIAKDFNDDALGRCLDAISDYGTTKFFTEISFEIGLEHNLIGNTLRGDTTTLLVYGEYSEKDQSKEKAEFTERLEVVIDESKPSSLSSEVTETPNGEDSIEKKIEDANEDQEPEVGPAYGHSKAKRSDLKQMVLHLATTGSSDFPIWMEAHSGNASDKKTLIEAAQRMKDFKEQINIDKDFLFCGDSAFYSGAVKNGGGMKWLSRVPENIKEAQKILILLDKELSWTDLGNGYQMHMSDAQYGGVEQRWALIYSEQAYSREVKTLEKNIEKENEALTKKGWHISNQVFQCEKDAEKHALEIKSPKYHQISFEIEELMKHQRKGRPKKGEEPSVAGYKLNFTVKKDEEKITIAKRKKGRFILATNELNKDVLNDEEILVKYKEQSGTENGFAFIKNDAFEVDSIFLKKPSRITALMAIMCLCLMVYGFSQQKLRSSLKESGESIPDQRDRPTQTPRMQ